MSKAKAKREAVRRSIEATKADRGRRFKNTPMSMFYGRWATTCATAPTWSTMSADQIMADMRKALDGFAKAADTIKPILLGPRFDPSRLALARLLVEKL